MKPKILFFLLWLFMQFALSQTPGTIKWEYAFNTDLISAPALDSNGVIYIAANTTLFAFNPDGTTKWTRGMGEKISSGYAPVIGPENTVYFEAGDIFTAVSASGIDCWRIIESFFRFTNPVIGKNGSLYVGGYDNFAAQRGYYYQYLYVISPSGSIEKKIEVSDRFKSPAIDQAGTIYFYNGNLKAYSPDGTRLWEALKVNTYLATAPIIGSDGTIYTCNHSSDLVTQAKLCAINSDGLLKWQFNRYGTCHSSPVIGPDEKIYLLVDQTAYIVDSNGTQCNAFQFDGTNQSTPVIGSDGTVYFGAENVLYAHHPISGRKWTLDTGAELHPSSPVIADDGTLYTISGRRLLAIQTESHGLAISAWPKQNRNNQNNASLYNPNCPVAMLADSCIAVTPTSRTFSLDGSQSFDPDNDPLDYIWQVIEKPRNSRLTLPQTNASRIHVTLEENLYGIYIFSLTVTDHQDGLACARTIVHYGEKWSCLTEGGIKSPTIGPDGKIYVFSKAANDYCYVLDHNGSIMQTYRYYHNFPPSTVEDVTERYLSYDNPIISENGDCYVVHNSHSFYYKNPYYYLISYQRWEYQFDMYTEITQPAIGPDNGLVFGLKRQEAPHQLYTLNSDSTLRRNYQIEVSVENQPIIGPDGTIYFTHDRYLYAYDLEGHLNWKTDVVTKVNSNLAIGPGSIVILSNSKGNIFSVRPDGSIQWKYLSQGNQKTSATVAGDGSIYFGSDNGTFYALDPDGYEKWLFQANRAIKTTPAIDADGTIYFGSDDSLLYALNPDGSKKWEFRTRGAVRSSPAIATDGTVYFGSDDGYLYASAAPGKSLAEGIWPKLGRNNGMTNSAYDVNCPVAEVAQDSFYVWEGAETITFDATPSANSQGDALSFLWRILSKPQDSDAILSDSTSAMLEISTEGFPIGEYIYSVTVTNHQHGYSSERVYLQVKDVNSAIGNSSSAYIPDSFHLYPLFPNPFNTSARIQFDLPVECLVEISVYNIAGEFIGTTLHCRKPAGIYNTVWDASNLGSGVYLVRMDTGDFSQSRKCVLLK